MLMGALICFGPTAQALTLAPLNQVIFSEVLLGTSSSSSQEFIEIYNPTATDLDLAGWHVQYVSATKTDWSSLTRNIALTGTLKAGDYYLLASSGYLSDKANLSYSSTLSQAGGHLRILDINNATQDQIGWGNAVMPLGVAAAAPVAGSSLARLTNESGYNLSLDNATDFSATLSPTPGADNVITEPAPADDPSTTDPGTTLGGLGGGTSTPPVTVVYPVVQISELLPNPASPQIDSQDEFVELYNPNSEDVDLTGYTITTGLKGTYRLAIKGIIIPAAGYATFYSGSTPLSLSNTAGKAQLFAPNGNLLDETSAYDTAQPGQSWIFNNGSWVWSVSPTPNSENTYSAPPAGVVKAISAKTPSTKIVKVKSMARKVAKAPKKKAMKATKPLANATPAPKTTKVHPVVLASVGSTALIYAMYEYRNDLANNIYRARRYRETRGSFWPAYSAALNSRAARRFGRWQNNFRSRLGAWFRK